MRWRWLKGGRHEIVLNIAEEESCGYFQALMRSIDPADFCLDCGVDTAEIGHYYMVKDLLWLSVNPTPKGMLCLNCLEVRMGREIAPADFTTAPINHDLLRLLRGKSRAEFQPLAAQCLERLRAIE